MRANALKACIIEAGMNCKDFCKATGISYQNFHKRMEGKVDFKLKEARTAANVLKLSDKRVIEIFFTD